jgi:hypothetical protein
MWNIIQVANGGAKVWGSGEWERVGRDIHGDSEEKGSSDEKRKRRKEKAKDSELGKIEIVNIYISIDWILKEEVADREWRKIMIVHFWSRLVGEREKKKGGF